MKKLAYKIAVVIAVYFFVSITVYRFKHPKMTETELFKNIPEALLWK